MFADPNDIPAVDYGEAIAPSRLFYCSYDHIVAPHNTRRVSPGLSAATSGAHTPSREQTKGGR